MPPIMVPAAFMASTLAACERMTDQQLANQKRQLALKESFGTLDRESAYVLRVVRATMRMRSTTIHA